MSNLNSSSDDGDDSAAFSFRSAGFIVATISGLAAVLFDAYLMWRYWGKAPDYVVLVCLCIGVQSVYQWFRVRLALAKVQEFASEKADDEIAFGPALQQVVSRMNEVLYVSYGITFFALSLIGALLGR